MKPKNSASLVQKSVTQTRGVADANPYLYSNLGPNTKISFKFSFVFSRIIHASLNSVNQNTRNIALHIINAVLDWPLTQGPPLPEKCINLSLETVALERSDRVVA
jgi:hypothetical protein